MADTRISGLTELTSVDNTADVVPIADVSATATKKVKVKNLINSYGATKGRILVGDGTDYVVLAVGSNDQVLTADSAQTTGVKWATPSSLTTGATLTAPSALYSQFFQTTVNTLFISTLQYSGAYPFRYAVCDGSYTYFTEDFSGVDNWSDADSAKIGMNTTNDNLDFDCVGDNSNDSCSFDLGASQVSNTLWVLRFKIRFTTLTATAAGNRVWVGLSDSSSATGSDTAQDFIGMCFFKVDSTVYCSDADGANLFTDDTSLAYNFTTGTDYYCEIKRTSATSYTCTMYSDSAYSSSLATANGTCASTNSSHRYIVVRNYKGTAGGEAIGTIDDVKLWSGVSTAVTGL